MFGEGVLHAVTLCTRAFFLRGRARLDDALGLGAALGRRRIGRKLPLQKASCLRILLSRAGVCTKEEHLIPAREMGDGSEQGSIPEGAERGRVRSSIRQRGAVPCGGGQVAVAGRLRLPALRRPAAQRNQDPRALSVHRLPAADVADCRDDLHGDQACAAELVSRPLSSDPEQAGHLQPGARPPPRRHPDDGVDGQAQTQAGDDGARRQEAPDRPPRDGRRLPRRPPLRRQAGTRRGWQDADCRHRRDHRRRPAGAPQAAPGAGLPAQRDRGLGQAQPGCRLHRRQRWSGVFPRCHRGRLQPPADPHRLGPQDRPRACLQVGQHRARQHQDGDRRYLSGDPRQARPALSGRVRVPLQPPLRPRGGGRGEGGGGLDRVPGESWDLFVTMDDATSEIYSAFFVAEEGTMQHFARSPR